MTAKGAPVLINQPVARRVIPTPAAEVVSPRVELYTATLGHDGASCALSRPASTRWSSPGFGVGHVSDTWLDTLTELAARVPVVLTSGTGAGPL